LSWSLAAHAGFIALFLLLSATRQPLMIPQVARPVRLVTYLEPAAAPRLRAAVTATPEAARTVPVPSGPQVAPTAPIPAPAAAAAAASRVVIPVREREPATIRTPAPTAESHPTLSERLTRGLAAAAPAASRPAEIATPQIANLPPSEVVASAPSPDRAPLGTPAAQPGAVTPIGYFPHAWYLALLKKNVFDRWLPPPDLFRSSRPPTALVSFRIDRAGRISAITLKEASGSARFDTSALAAVQGLGQVSPLPAQYAEETLDVIIRFQYQP
jgi:TonB family protein